ncbi:MAG: M20 family metallopeptidase [Candidatus Acidiferrales bacterium]
MLRLLARFVRCESPSREKPAVDAMARILAAEWRRRGAHVRILRQPKRGNHVRAEIWLGHGRPAGVPAVADSSRSRGVPTVAALSRRWGLPAVAELSAKAGQILVLGHMDTVYPLGTLAKMPFRISRGRAWGPGAFDMKGGLVIALFAVDALRAARLHPRKRLVFLWTSDEEIGSETSRRSIEAEARRSDAVLVLEPPLGRAGRLKTARKGAVTAEIIVTGRAAHAGIEPEKGVNAVHELFFQIGRLMKWNNPRRGITVQATVISGGTASNVVPAHASAQIDIRYAHAADARLIARKLRTLRPILKGARIDVRTTLGRPPLERTAAVEKLFRQAQSLMSEMTSEMKHEMKREKTHETTPEKMRKITHKMTHEMAHQTTREMARGTTREMMREMMRKTTREISKPLGEASTGGGSDGNLTAALGIPTLDGLGPVGDAAHSPREHILTRSLPHRAALLAALLATL